MRLFFFIGAFFLLVSCTQKEHPRFMFQNGVGLNLEAAGCSILDLGGAGRMCERVRTENPDLFFQVGPAFSFLIPKEVSSEKRDLLRQALIKVWNSSGVKLYSVDSLDLSPSLESFLKITESKKFSLLSTNIRDKKGSAPFSLYQKLNWNKHVFIFLSFTGPKEPTESIDWRAISFKGALNDLGSLLSENASAQLLILGSLSPSQREELATALGRKAYFVGGTLEEENSTEWMPISSGSFWAKAVDLGRGIGTIQWNSAASGALGSQFSSKGLRKDLDAANQCTKVVNEVLGSSR